MFLEKINSATKSMMLSNDSPENLYRHESRTVEDQDILERSTKKTKRHDGDMGCEDMEGIEEAHGGSPKVHLGGDNQNSGEHDGHAQPNVSYRNILEGITRSMEAERKELEEMSDDEKDEKEYMDTPECPLIKITKEDKLRIRRQFKLALIIKVMGRNVRYTYLLKRLNTIWHPKSKMELTSMENDYYLVKFNSVADYEFAKYGGPWMILEHYLIVKEWRPDFRPHSDATERVLVWVRFPDLPLEYFDNSILFRIGKKIGNPIRIDGATSLISKGKFARLCVEVDLTKPLLSKFWMRKKVWRIEYEGIHMICFKCGIYGHNAGTCMQGEEPRVPEVSPELRQEETAMGEQRVSNAVKGNSNSGASIADERPEIRETYGPWMLAKKATRGRHVNQSKRSGRDSEGNKISNNGYNGTNNIRKETEVSIGRRFDILNEANPENEVDEPTSEELWAEKINNTTESSPSEQFKNKGKRPAVQAIEKQIMGTNSNMRRTQSGPRVGVNEEPGIREKAKRAVNKAAAADEHIVVRGEKFGEVISTIKVTGQEDNGLCHGIPELTMSDHHEDQPSTSIGVDLNFTINNNELFADKSLTEGGSDMQGPHLSLN